MGTKGRALTFLTPEDEPAWRQLRRQGAPDLPEVDLSHLFNAGDWRYIASTLVQVQPTANGNAPRPARNGQSWNTRRRRSRSRGPRPLDQRPASTA